MNNWDGALVPISPGAGEGFRSNRLRGAGCVEEDSTAAEVAAHSAGCTGFKVWRTAIIASS